MIDTRLRLEAAKAVEWTTRARLEPDTWERVDKLMAEMAVAVRDGDEAAVRDTIVAIDDALSRVTRRMGTDAEAEDDEAELHLADMPGSVRARVNDLIHELVPDGTGDAGTAASPPGKG